MLLPTINEKETAKQVRQFFKEDYPRLCRQAGRSTIKAVTYSNTPKASLTDNSREKAMTSALLAQELLNSVYEAVKQCSDDSRLILAEKYGRHTASWKIARRLGYESTRYYEKQNEALLEFADAFTATGAKVLDDPKKADFHVYE